MKTLILASLLIGAAVSAQTTRIDSIVSQFEKDQAKAIEKVNLKWFVDSASIEAKIVAARAEVADPENYGAFYDLSREEFVAKAADKASAALKEMDFYRRERDSKLRSAFRAYVARK